MKKTFALAAIVALMSAPVFAANTQGGFSGPGATATATETETETSSSQSGGFVGAGGSVTTVKKVEAMSDKTWVTLRGNLVERVSDDGYKFKDATGTVNVEIDHKRWNGVTVAPQDVVEIQGEVDKEWSSAVIDVKQINKVSQ